MPFLPLFASPCPLLFTANNYQRGSRQIYMYLTRQTCLRENIPPTYTKLQPDFALFNFHTLNFIYKINQVPRFESGFRKLIYCASQKAGKRVDWLLQAAQFKVTLAAWAVASMMH